MDGFLQLTATAAFLDAFAEADRLPEGVEEQHDKEQRPDPLRHRVRAAHAQPRHQRAQPQ